MYTKDLKSTLVSKGYTTSTTARTDHLSIRYEGQTVAVVSLVDPFVLQTTFPAFHRLSPAHRLRLHQILTEYAETPINERTSETPETVYAYFLTDVIGEMCYVNYVRGRDAISIDTKSDTPGTRTHFTDSYIEAHPALDAWLAKYADVLDTEIIRQRGV